ncbi:MAG TPA: hypothetical protein P5531_11645 [Bacteroidales bacterium]|nr:hypothetical protein [Bacteroidales bacterium]HSA44217.1 hypothetical protein [Bacteroidales bacterium]
MSDFNVNQGLLIRNAREHNLKGISLEIPHNRLTVVVGVSGSGKSSLAFDVIAAEGQRRFLETFPSFSRLFMGKVSQPEVDAIENLPPVITLPQKTTGNSSRSTLGTMCDLYDMLRLLFARLGKGPEGLRLSRSLFSFNSAAGACPRCKGLGLEEQIAASKLVNHPGRSIRQGALAPTLPNGYIMYSQVTPDVLNQVCLAHGFDVDTPWNELSEESKAVIFYGSDKIRIPFGKHPLENRLKWTGITAKPREEGYYRGLITIMSEILQRDRNDSILRYAESRPCSACDGKRLNPGALSVKITGAGIDTLSAISLKDLTEWLTEAEWTPAESQVAGAISESMLRQLRLLIRLGLGHLSLHTSASALTSAEAQRIRLVNHLQSGLSHVLYVFDEPTAGMHPSEVKPLVEIIRALVEKQNTVIVVEHDELFIRHADWIVDMGPGPGKLGGQLLFNGPASRYFREESLKGVSPGWDMLHDTAREHIPPGRLREHPVISIMPVTGGMEETPLFSFLQGALNVVSGASGSGKADLVYGFLKEAWQRKGIAEYLVDGKMTVRGLEDIQDLVVIDQSPIGRTPRSNPATYTGWSDKLRDLFAGLDEAKALGLSKSHFSFNTPGGRCETCQGAGVLQTGMHFLGNVSLVCPGCQGKRFHDESLRVRYRGKTISEIMDLTVDQVVSFFSDRPAMLKSLHMLQKTGLGYLSPGQPSTTLSGGEAQRIKLAAYLQQKQGGKTLYILDEPSTGLHSADVEKLSGALMELAVKGNTIVCIDQDWDIIRRAGHWIHLGKQTPENEFQILFQGSPAGLTKAGYLALPSMEIPAEIPEDTTPERLPVPVRFQGVSTHYLKDIDVEIPWNRLTVVTGISGSGKSSLAFDTIFSEAQNRFTESFSTYTRSLLKLSNPARFVSCGGLSPAVAINRKYLAYAARSTVGTITGLYDHFRLLYARIAAARGLALTARHFSFNHQLGACPSCDGLGVTLRCDPALLISHPELSILEGAMQGHKAGRFYGDPDGQYLATLRTVASELGLNLNPAWKDMDREVRDVILYGTGDRQYQVVWEFRNRSRAGTHRMQTSWTGFCNLVEDEYKRKYLNKNTRETDRLMHEVECEVCRGARLKPELLEIRFRDLNIAGLSGFSMKELLGFFSGVFRDELPGTEGLVFERIRQAVLGLLRVMDDLGIAHLTADRPSASLSGGESQRVRLASAFSSGLYGVTYVLDEPTTGLHSRDIQPLVRVVKQLIGKGNTAVVVEHETAFIREADHIIEMGPGAGPEGGRVVASGDLQCIMQHPDSLTGRILKAPPVLQPPRTEVLPDAFGVRGANINNLRHIDVSFIAGGIIAVTGVSGSGKSSLVSGALLASHHAGRPVGCRAVFGLEHFDHIAAVGQQSLSTGGLSSTATYSGFMDVLRDIFAAEAVKQGSRLGKSAFSYLSDGKCPACGGYGTIKTAMDFMSDIRIPCDTCGGSRYKEDVLRIQLHGRNIADVLDMTVNEALEFFSDRKEATPYLQVLNASGAGHLKLGQPAATLSGGEAQRLKLATGILRFKKGRMLFVFDEPAAGLHSEDILKLAGLFRKLTGEGHTLLFIGHQPLLISLAHQVIELGPGSGPEGGRLVRNLLKDKQ